MSTHDYNIANASGASVRQDINNALAAILSNNSNNSEPSTTAAYMTWANSSSGVDSFNIRNSGNSDFVEVFRIDGTHIKLTNVSVLALEDGTASSCALSFNDDLNTGIFSSAADTFNVATGGVERMELGATTIFNEDGADVNFRIEGDTEANLFFVDAGENRIGIGTASPGAMLHLSKDTPVLRLTDSSTDRHAQFVCIDGNLRIDADNDNAQSNTNISFRTDGQERMRLNDTGLGIGTTDPNYKLVVQGSGVQTILAGSTNAAGAALILDGDSNGDGSGSDYASITHTVDGNIEINNRKAAATIFKHNISSNETEIARFNNAGNLGIDNNSPQGELHIGKSDNSDHEAMIILNNGGASGQEAGIEFRYESGTTPRAKIHVNSSDQIIRFSTGGNEAARIDGNGKMAIGHTSSISTRLEVKDSAHCGLTLISDRTTATDNVGAYQFKSASNDVALIQALVNGAIKFRNTNALLERMRIDEFGFVGVGEDSPVGFSSDARNLVISTSTGNCGLTINTDAADQVGSIFFAEGTGATGRGRIRYEHANNAMAFSSFGSEAMRIDSVQRLLLGATSAYDTASGNAKVQIDGVGGAGIAVTGNSTSSQTRVSFFNPNGRVGFISTDGSATVYNTSGSDKKLKKNFESWTENTLDLFKNINPQKFNFIHEDDEAKKSKGFIAQEMVNSFPEAYTKEDKKDAKYYFNPSGMVVYLMKAIQELEAKVAALEAA